MHAEEEARAVGDGSVALAGFRGWGVEKMDGIGMDLFQRDELEIRCAEGGLETAAVFKDVFFGVPFGEAQIENFLGVLEGDAAGLGAEAMDEPGEFYERGNLEDSNAAHVALGPNVTGASA